jgi:transposase
VISVAEFDSIANYHAQGMSQREIARRLGIDPKTVRRNLRKIRAGATEPQRTSPGSKLDPFRDRVKALGDEGWTAWSIHQELSAEPEYDNRYQEAAQCSSHNASPACGWW